MPPPGLVATRYHHVYKLNTLSGARSVSSYAAVFDGSSAGCPREGPPSEGSAAASPPQASLEGGDGGTTDGEDGVSSSGTAPLLQHSHTASTSEDELVRRCVTCEDAN